MSDRQKQLIDSLITSLTKANASMNSAGNNEVIIPDSDRETKPLTGDSTSAPVFGPLKPRQPETE